MRTVKAPVSARGGYASRVEEVGETEGLAELVWEVEVPGGGDKDGEGDIVLVTVAVPVGDTWRA